MLGALDYSDSSDAGGSCQVHAPCLPYRFPHVYVYILLDLCPQTLSSLICVLRLLYYIDTCPQTTILYFTLSYCYYYYFLALMIYIQGFFVTTTTYSSSSHKEALYIYIVVVVTEKPCIYIISAELLMLRIVGKICVAVYVA